MVLNVREDGENNPYTETPGNHAQVDPKGAAFDLLFGQRWRGGGRWPFFAPDPLCGSASKGFKAGGGRVHRFDIAMAKIIQTSRQPMTCWAVLHKTTTTKVKGSIIDRGRWKAGGGRGS